jgi:hypothetical protein
MTTNARESRQIMSREYCHVHNWLKPFPSFTFVEWDGCQRYWFVSEDIARYWTLNCSKCVFRWFCPTVWRSIIRDQKSFHSRQWVHLLNHSWIEQELPEPGLVILTIMMLDEKWQECNKLICFYSPRLWFPVSNVLSRESPLSRDSVCQYQLARTTFSRF